MSTARTDYQLVPEARKDLEAIWHYSYEKWGLNQANTYVDALVDVFSRIAEFPLSGTSCGYLRKGYRCASSGSHTIYYLVTDRGVTIVRILHERMMAGKHL